MKKLIVIVLLVLIAVIASGCGEELMYKKCFNEYPSVCYLSTFERSYLEVDGIVVMPFVADERVVGTWRIEYRDDPLVDMRPDNTVSHWTNDGYIEGAWVYFGPYGTYAEYENGFSSFIIFSGFSEDGDVVHVKEVSDTELMGEGTFHRVVVYTGEPL